jgi:uncharacterized protein (DUF1697 family)
VPGKPPGVAVALFRGINVGGNKIVRMEELRGLFEELGYGEARTLIQSGNVAFRSKDAASKTAKHIAGAFAKRWGFESHVLVRSLAAWREALAANPFKAELKDPKRLVIGSLASELSDGDRELLKKNAAAGEKWRSDGETLYAYFPNGQGPSKLAAAMVRMKTPATMRNWDTAQKLLALAEALESEDL